MNTEVEKNLEIESDETSSQIIDSDFVKPVQVNNSEVDPMAQLVCGFEIDSDFVKPVQVNNSEVDPMAQLVCGFEIDSDFVKPVQVNNSEDDPMAQIVCGSEIDKDFVKPVQVDPMAQLVCGFEIDSDFVKPVQVNNSEDDPMAQIVCGSEIDKDFVKPVQVDPMAQFVGGFEIDSDLSSTQQMLSKARDLFVSLLIEEIKERCPILVSPIEISVENSNQQQQQFVIYIGCLNGCETDFCFFFVEPATQTSMSCLLNGWRNKKYISGESAFTMLLQWKLFMDELKSFESYIYKKFVLDFIEIYRSRYTILSLN
jgi:hypothetical protein